MTSCGSCRATRFRCESRRRSRAWRWGSRSSSVHSSVKLLTLPANGKGWVVPRLFGGDGGGLGVGIDDAVQLDVEAEAAHFLDEHVEALRNAGLERVVALDDRLVHLGPADDVVRLHRQHFLKGVGSAVSLQCPHLHFAEALTAELRLTAQRLLGDEAVG